VIRRFHGIDRHKAYSTISVLDRAGQEIRFVGACDLKGYLKELGPQDAVVLEACGGSFWWADRIEERGAQCFVLDPNRLRIITESWNKTDRQDARNMAKALWVYLVTGEFGIPTVHKPAAVIRELRKLFSGYELLNRQVRMLKNGIQAVLLEEGVALSGKEKRRLFCGHPEAPSVLDGRELSEATLTVVEAELALLARVMEAKEQLGEKIVAASEPLADQVRLLMTIRGITALTAAAFLADVGDIRRFRSASKMSAYLGLVPRCRDSGGKSRPGHITRKSRRLARTMLTQSIYQVTRSSPQLAKQYATLIERRGAGRARIAMIRRLCGIMRRMLLTGAEFRWVSNELYERKLRNYEKTLEAARRQRQAA
jgi:transposase